CDYGEPASAIAASIAYLECHWDDFEQGAKLAPVHRLSRNGQPQFESGASSNFGSYRQVATQHPSVLPRLVGAYAHALASLGAIERPKQALPNELRGHATA